jgi:hypothetical protein
MNAEKLNNFITRYRLDLQDAVEKYPSEYAFPVAMVDTVVERMKSAIQRNSFNKDGRALKATCKAFGIAHTYKAIDAFLERNK